MNPAGDVAAAHDRLEQHHDSAPVEEPTVSLRGIRVLVIEDERAIRELIVRSLRVIGVAEVIDVSCAESAWSLLVGDKAKPFHAVITDLSLPGVSGTLFIKKLRELPFPRAKTLPIIVLSADSSVDTYKKLSHSRISAYLIKPVSPALLHRALSRAISLPQLTVQAKTPPAPAATK